MWRQIYRARKTIVLGLIFLCILIAAAYAATSALRGSDISESGTTRTYQSSIYGFQFAYPSIYSMAEYTPQYIGIQDPSRTNDAEVVAVTVEVAEEGESESYADFVHRAAENTCAADGPNGSQRCTAVSRSDTYTTPKGLSAEVFYLTEETVLIGTATTTREAGPFYAFDISAHVPESPLAAIMVRPSHAAEEGDRYDQSVALAKAIVDSLEVTAP